MPYTPKERRPVENQEVKNIKLDTIGDLTAAIYYLQLKYIDTKGSITFDLIMDAIGAATAANDEIKRHIKNPYENECIRKAGNFEMLQSIREKINIKFRGPINDSVK